MDDAELRRLPLLGELDDKQLGRMRNTRRPVQLQTLAGRRHNDSGKVPLH